MGSFLVGLLAKIVSLIGGGIGGAIGTVNALLRTGFSQAMQFHEEGIAFARQMGMSLDQARAYTRALSRETKDLAKAYGVTSAQILEIQKNLAQATTRQLMLNHNEVESFVQINKLVGADVGKKFTEEILSMGGQVETAQKAVSKAYASAMKSGLNAAKVSEKISNNLGMANRLSFKNGIDGLTKMAIKAEKVGMSLESVEKVAGQFRDFDKAIESSARLQMLGGAAGAFGGNPLDMMYESNYDPEALQQRMEKMLGGYAQFDAKTGMSKINGLGMDFIRNIAKAMGIDEGEAAKIAKRNAELKYKEGAFGSSLGRYTDEQRDLIMNKSYVKDGKIYINDANQQAHEITNGKIDDALLEELSHFDNMSDKDILVEQSQKLTTINESIDGFWASAVATFSEKFNEVIPHIQKFIGDIGPKLMPIFETIGSGVEEFVKRTLTPENVKFVTDSISKIINVVGDVLGVVKSVWKWLPEWGKDAIIAIGAISMLPGGKSLLGGVSRAGAGAIGKMGGKVLGGAVGAGIGIYRAVTATNNADRGAGIGTAAGSIIGAALGGPIGAAIGGFLGDFAGKFIGEHWGDITNTISNAWNSISEWFKNAWDGWLGNVIDIIFPIVGVIRHWDEICEFVRNSWNSVSEWATGLWDSAVGWTKEAWGSVTGWAKDAWGSVTGWVKDAWSSVTGWVKDAWGGITGVWNKVTGAFSSVIDTFKSAIQGFANFVKDPWGSIKAGAKSLFEGVKNIAGYAEGKGGIESDNMLAFINDKEAVVPAHDQQNFLTTVKNIQSVLPVTSVVAKPVGGKEYIYTPSNSQTSNTNSEVKVNDFNVNISGTIRLDGGNNSQNIDVKNLLNDVSFISALKDIIKESMASDINGGRVMHDVSYLRGMPSQSTTLGRMPA